MRPRVFPRAASLALCVAALCLNAKADLINPTGNAELDFPAGGPGVFIIQDRVDDVAQSAWMSDKGWTTGWNIQDVRVVYDQKSDTLAVGVNFIGIAGDSDGNGDPGVADPKTTASGGLDLPHLGGRKSISVAFGSQALDGSLGAPLFVAGVSAIKTPGGGGGIDGFTVAQIVGNNGLAYSYGPTLTGVQAELLFDPSAAHPDFIFTIAKASKINGFNPMTGYYLSAFAGSPDDVVAGEDTVPWTKVPGVGLNSPQVVPEPSSFVLIALGGALGWAGARRRSKGEAKSKTIDPEV